MYKTFKHHNPAQATEAMWFVVLWPNTYDEAGQLKSETINGTTTNFSYDAGGNIRTKGSDTFHYDDTNWHDLLTKINATDILYDELGNPDKTINSRNETVLLEWQGRQLLKATMPDGSYETYAYNADGLRTSRTLFDENDNWTRKHEYSWSDGQLVGQQWSMPVNSQYPNGQTEDVKYIYDDGEIIGFVFNNQTGSASRLFAKNLQGDIVGIVSGQTNVLMTTYSYDAWGVPTVEFGNDNWQFVWGHGYRGYQYDLETGALLLSESVL